MGVSLDINNSINTFDKVYVLSVKSFSDRIAHITKQLSEHNIEFEFIFDCSDKADQKISKTQVRFKEGKLLPPHKDLVLKHIKAWENCVRNEYKTILVLEDDVILRNSFRDKIKKIYKKLSFLPGSYLIFLSGRDTRVPKEFLLSNDTLFKNKIPTADGYITDFKACKKRLKWLELNPVSKPADHLINEIDTDCDISQYWSREYLIEQGSVFGLFPSTLDDNRMRKPQIINFLRYYIKIIMRRILPLVLLKITLNKIK